MKFQQQPWRSNGIAAGSQPWCLRGQANTLPFSPLRKRMVLISTQKDPTEIEVGPSTIVTIVTIVALVTIVESVLFHKLLALIV